MWKYNSHKQSVQTIGHAESVVSANSSNNKEKWSVIWKLLLTQSARSEYTELRKTF